MAMTVRAVRAIPVLEAAHTPAPAAPLTLDLAVAHMPAPAARCMQALVVARMQVPAALLTPDLVVVLTQDPVAPVTPDLAVARMPAQAAPLTQGQVARAERANSASSLERVWRKEVNICLRIATSKFSD